jgi:hypothetical protein
MRLGGQSLVPLDSITQGRSHVSEFTNLELLQTVNCVLFFFHLNNWTANLLVDV